MFLCMHRDTCHMEIMAYKNKSNIFLFYFAHKINGSKGNVWSSGNKNELTAGCVQFSMKNWTIFIWFEAK